ncbi:hypothetical protein ACIOG8_32185 [Streptomyces erythrochromogenes]|uniref:hypothetical protein n=1 Tax=Streptomyces erythrochromogenes TaxID=285574 RepID=UPI003824BF66
MFTEPSGFLCSLGFSGRGCGCGGFVGCGVGVGVGFTSGVPPASVENFTGSNCLPPANAWEVTEALFSPVRTVTTTLAPGRPKSVERLSEFFPGCGVGAAVGEAAEEAEVGERVVEGPSP